jgi:hypothetical protein
MTSDTPAPGARPRARRAAALLAAAAPLAAALATAPATAAFATPPLAHSQTRAADLLTTTLPATTARTVPTDPKIPAGIGD